MRTRTALLLGQTTAFGLMMALLVVPASALFLHAYGASALPWPYLVVAVAGALAALADTEPARRATAIELAEATLGRRRRAVAPAQFPADVAIDRAGCWDSAWLRASLLRCLRLSREDAERAAGVLAADPDEVVAQTAAWVLSR